MRTPSPLVISSIRGAETIEATRSPLATEAEAARTAVVVLTAREMTVATPAPHRKATSRFGTGSGSHRSIHRTATNTMPRGTKASRAGQIMAAPSPAWA